MVALVAGGALLLAAGVRRDLAPEELAAYAAEPSRFLPLAGMSVHYRDEGTRTAAPPLLLLHGTAASLHTWDGWAAELSADHRVLRLDLPGFGLTGPNRGHRYAPEDDVAVLDGFLDALGLEAVALGGNSLGGLIALEYTLARPHRVSHLILVDSAGLPHRSVWAFKLAEVPGLGLLVRWITPRFVIAGMLRDVYGDEAKVSGELVTRYHRLLLRRGNRAALAARRRTPRRPVAGRLGEITVPTLILWGGLDDWIPPVDGYRFHEAIAGSELRVYPGLGHVPMEEAPRRTARDVREFLAAAG